MLDLQSSLRYALGYIDAIPNEVAERFPAMPGFDRDHAETLLQSAPRFARHQGKTLDPASRPISNAGHVIVWARPKDRNWAGYDGTNNLGLQNEEWRPCLLVGGDPTSRRLVLIGDASHYRLDEFDIAEDVVR